jgi:mRNA interferase MazF
VLPGAGDIAWFELDPVRGTEEAGRRPGIVVSELAYNEHSARILICPISRREPPWPFNVPLPSGMKSEGVVLVDQVRMVDRPARMFRPIEKAPAALLAEVRARLMLLIGVQTKDSR